MIKSLSIDFFITTKQPFVPGDLQSTYIDTLNIDLSADTESKRLLIRDCLLNFFRSNCGMCIFKSVVEKKNALSLEEETQTATSVISIDWNNSIASLPWKMLFHIGVDPIKKLKYHTTINNFKSITNWNEYICNPIGVVDKIIDILRVHVKDNIYNASVSVPTLDFSIVFGDYAFVKMLNWKAMENAYVSRVSYDFSAMRTDVDVTSSLMKENEVQQLYVNPKRKVVSGESTFRF